MNCLLDTHILLWAAAGSLPEAAALYVENEANTLYFSPASIWEIIIKNGLGRKDFAASPSALHRGLLDAGYLELPIRAEHSLAVEHLPMLHKDPFDRILLAQALTEQYTFITADRTVAKYPGAVILV